MHYNYNPHTYVPMHKTLIFIFFCHNTLTADTAKDIKTFKNFYIYSKARSSRLRKGKRDKVRPRLQMSLSSSTWTEFNLHHSCPLKWVSFTIIHECTTWWSIGHLVWSMAVGSTPCNAPHKLSARTCHCHQTIWLGTWHKLESSKSHNVLAPCPVP